MAGWLNALFFCHVFTGNKGGLRPKNGGILPCLCTHNALTPACFHAQAHITHL